jgi:hypothetical protein
VLGALEETEGIGDVHADTAANRDAVRVGARSEQAAVIARERFAVGSTDFLTVLDAERELLSARDRLAQAQAGAPLRWSPSTNRSPAAGKCRRNNRCAAGRMALPDSCFTF